MVNEVPQSRRTFAEVALSFAAGALFAVGLALAGMTQPSKVLAFLDVSGAWDPSLALVMAGAVAVYFVANRLAQRRTAPLAAERFHLQSKQSIEPRLLIGAGLFGVGWGLAGYCPGPALTSLAIGSASALTFVIAMVSGMLLFDRLSRVRTPRGARSKLVDHVH